MPLKTRVYQTFVTMFIAGVLLLQAGASSGFGFLNLGSRSRWPFIGYRMYDDVHYEGETIQAYYELEGTLTDGTIVQIAREDLGLIFWNFLYLGNNLAENSPADVNLLLKLYPKANQLVEIRVKTLPLMITRSGQAYKPPVIVRTIPVNLSP